MIEKAYYRLEVHFETPLLGAQSSADVMTKYVHAKRGIEASESELEMLPDDELNLKTSVFHRSADGEPVLMSHQLKGYFKEAAGVLNGKAGGKTKVKNLKSKVRSLVFVVDQVIALQPPEQDTKLSMLVDTLERPIRRDTMYGPKASLTRSEMLPAGTWFRCALEVYPGEVDEEVLRDLLDYGWNAGMGQWRDGGFGRFRYQLTKE